MSFVATGFGFCDVSKQDSWTSFASVLSVDPSLSKLQVGKTGATSGNLWRVSFGFDHSVYFFGVWGNRQPWTLQTLKVNRQGSGPFTNGSFDTVFTKAVP